MKQANGLPYYKAYPRDFIEGTVGMPLEIKGAYRILLDLIYMSGGQLVDDPRYIAGVLGCSVRKWGNLRDQLVVSGKLQIIDGLLINHRAVIELEKLTKLQDKQRENARSPRKNKGLQKPWLHQPEPEPEPELDGGDDYARAREASPQFAPENSRPPSAPKPSGPSLRERILVACNADPVSGLTGPNGGVLGTRSDMHAVDRWRSDLGLDDQVIVAIIREVMARKRDGPPARLSYFNRAMQREAGSRNQPKLEPIDALPSSPESLPAAGSGTSARGHHGPSGLVGVAMRRAAARRAAEQSEV